VDGPLISVKTDKPIDFPLKFAAQTATSQLSDNLPVRIKVCGYEKVTLVSSKYEKGYSKLDQASNISE
jgi:hypothetical protein